ncbi:hypothetical protein COCC4DRAFT_129637 [Bipolaris maydis ATCC 48331]|uniref:Uncharacterized protein n=2 Tax=Cochliobolus heterostrophus TaxID=5016 RepID=M2UDP2_COCH5|nr:uncharacterized protein COCC4DRAFT_129637 [Bipolaris maydis ATCC 48331]EMD91796.1 hypothetical protein COCHEDRAFT_1156133 [Bipolaris maydis C5]ENI08446.1 hypothetical protein COCC4DRAFT_129637 [Bipolaris maydis ATCC 48331]
MPAQTECSTASGTNKKRDTHAWYWSALPPKQCPVHADALGPGPRYRCLLRIHSILPTRQPHAGNQSPGSRVHGLCRFSLS